MLMWEIDIINDRLCGSLPPKRKRGTAETSEVSENISEQEEEGSKMEDEEEHDMEDSEEGKVVTRVWRFEHGEGDISYIHSELE